MHAHIYYLSVNVCMYACMYVYIFIYMKSGLLMNSDQYYHLLKKEEDNSQKFDLKLGTLTKKDNTNFHLRP